jgi:radical SAM protein with 4Fe4S-binding SPASM domain
MELSPHVHETTEDGRPVFYNLLTKRSLPMADAAAGPLRDGFFLAGQEEQAARAALASYSPTLVLNVNPTWECTLRCKHCCVLTQLVKEQRETIDVPKFVGFVDRCLAARAYERFNMSFAGGEPLLRPATIVGCVEGGRALAQKHGRSFSCGMTTNGTVPLDPEVVRALECVDRIVVSIDGLKDYHNHQRRPFQSHIDPFDVALANVEAMQDLGLNDKIRIQAALPDHLLDDADYIAAFFRFFLEMGIADVVWGSIHPTDVVKPSQHFVQNLKGAHFRNEPCCKFRVASAFSVDPSHRVFDTVWEWTQSELGTLDSDPEEIYGRQLEMIYSSFPCLKDKTCMSCPAMGVCWGGCVNGVTLVGDKPSYFCDRRAMVDKVRACAADGTLVPQSRVGLRSVPADH